MTGKRTTALVASAALLCLAAYVSASYLLWPAVMDSGGGHAGSENYELDCSIGGPVIAPVAAGGEASSANYKLEVNSVGVLTKGVQVQPAPGGGGGGCVGDVGGPGGPVAFPLLLAWTTGWFAQRPRRRERRVRQRPRA